MDNNMDNNINDNMENNRDNIVNNTADDNTENAESMESTESVESTDSVESTEKTESSEEEVADFGAVEPVFSIYKPSADLKKPAEGFFSMSNPLFLILSFVVPAVIFLLGMVLNEVSPFGDKTILYSDARGQYYPFLQELYDKLHNGGSLFWLWNLGGGTNFWAIFAYYLATPLNMLLYFCPREYLLEGMVFLILIKIALSSLFFAVFLKSVFKRNDFSLIAFGCCYALCSFAMGYFWNIMWLDPFMLMPLVALGVYRLVYYKKHLLYTISLAAVMYCNYYIGFMVCVFTAFWFFTLWLKNEEYNNKKEKLSAFKKSLKDIIIYSVIGIGISAVLILPVFVQLKNTTDAASVGKNLFSFYHNYLKIIANLFGFNNPASGAVNVSSVLPNIYSGVICLVLTTIFAVNKKISKREKIVDFIFIGFMLLSLNFRLLDFMWHGLHFPDWMPFRYAFVFSFYLIFMAYRAFNSMEDDFSFSLTIPIVAMVFLLLITYTQSGDNLQRVVWNMVIIALYLILISLMIKKRINMRVFTVLLSIIIVFEMGNNCWKGMENIFINNRSYIVNTEEINALKDEINKANEDGEFFRVDQTEVYAMNDGSYYGYHSNGLFSSTADARMIKLADKLGLVSRSSSWSYMLTSPVTTSFLNIKYLIGRERFTGDDSTLTEITRNNRIRLYEYENYLPLGFMMQSGASGINVDNYSLPFELQNDLFSSATGLSGDVFTMFSADEETVVAGDVKRTGQAGRYKYELPDKKQTVVFEYTVPEDGMVYCYANFRSDAKELRLDSDKRSHEYNLDNRRYIFPVGEYNAGDVLIIKVPITSSAKGEFIINMAMFDKELFNEGYALLNDETLKTTFYDDTKIEGTIDVASSGMMYTSVLNDGGWSVYVDGSRVNPVTLLDTFIGIPLTPGTHRITMKYTPPFFYLGLGVSLISLAALILLTLYNKKKNAKEVEK